jgi:hypothetical protein
MSWVRCRCTEWQVLSGIDVFRIRALMARVNSREESHFEGCSLLGVEGRLEGRDDDTQFRFNHTGP